MMVKRYRHEDSDSQPVRKRLRPDVPDRLSYLSDEVLLRTLSFLPVSDLLLCQRYAIRRHNQRP